MTSVHFTIRARFAREVAALSQVQEGDSWVLPHCPACNRANAMLDTYNGASCTWTCRDCNSTHITQVPVAQHAIFSTDPDDHQPCGGIVYPSFECAQVAFEENAVKVSLLPAAIRDTLDASVVRRMPALAPFMSAEGVPSWMTAEKVVAMTAAELRDAEPLPHAVKCHTQWNSFQSQRERLLHNG